MFSELALGGLKIDTILIQWSIAKYSHERNHNTENKTRNLLLVVLLFVDYSGHHFHQLSYRKGCKGRKVVHRPCWKICTRVTASCFAKVVSIEKSGWEGEYWWSLRWFLRFVRIVWMDGERAEVKLSRIVGVALRRFGCVWPSLGNLKDRPPKDVGSVESRRVQWITKSLVTFWFDIRDTNISNF